MEGVGARLGRSSTRYGGPATVFTGPVRKWKKKWVPILNPNSNNNNSSNAGNGGANNNSSHLLLYKWTPISSSTNNNNSTPSTPAPATTNAGKDAAATATASAAAPEEAPRRKFRYVPVSVIEEQKQEAAANAEEESKANDSDTSPKAQNDGGNDVPMEDAQASGKDPGASQDTSETNLDLSLGLKAHGETDQKMTGRTEGGGGQSECVMGSDVEMKPAANSDAENRAKRKAPAPDLEMRV